MFVNHTLAELTGTIVSGFPVFSSSCFGTCISGLYLYDLNLTPTHPFFQFRLLLTLTICATLWIVLSKGGDTSLEDWVAQIRIPSKSYPVLPTAISPGCYPNIRNNEISFPPHYEDDIRSKILTSPAFLSSFRRIDPATTTLGSTKSEITGRSVLLYGLSCPRAVRPFQNIGWRRSRSLPDLTQSYRRLSHLDVTQTFETMRSLSH